MICSTLGYSRQAFYKHKQIEELELARNERILDFVAMVRKEQPRAGGRKLLRMLSNLNDPDLVIGRDKFFGLLEAHNLLISRKKRGIRTSVPDFDRPIFPNLLDGYVSSRINQAWVVDITYLNTCKGFAYLFLLSDLHSRKILGYTLAEDMKADNACLVLQKALQTVSDPSQIIHHSDHGSQYSSKAYQKILNDNKLSCSMTGPNRCYDNAVAERINGILKQEFGLGMTFPDIRIAREAVTDAIMIYNAKRLHVSLGYQTPDSVYYGESLDRAV